MNLFIIAAVILTGLAVATVLWPLLRNSGDAPAAPVTAVVLGLLLPAGVLVIYLSVSNYDWLAAESDPVRMGGGGRSTDLNEMAANLENRLRTEPDNVDGWLLLGRSYAELQQVSASRRAYRQAMALDPSTEAKLGVAEADISLDRSNLLGDAGQLVEEVLVVEPQNPKALFYGGMVAMSRHDIDTFRDRWQQLLAMSPPDEIRAVIEAELAKADITTEPIEKMAQGIDVNVSVSGELAERIQPGAVLFLVAREAERPGPPLAVVRHDVRKLPVKLNISDANAMMPGRQLSSLPRVQLIARITNSGEPQAQQGDLFGETSWTANENPGMGISIDIDQVVD